MRTCRPTDGSRKANSMRTSLRNRAVTRTLGVAVLVVLAAGSWALHADLQSGSRFIRFSAPAGNRPATANTVIDGLSGAVLPNGRLLTPAGTEVSVQAPKPFGLALSPNGAMLATVNSGAAPFSLTLISQLTSGSPTVKRINVNASFMGVTFSKDNALVYVSGGENGNIWIGSTALGTIVGSVNLNGPAHPLDRPLNVVSTPTKRIKGTYPGNMVLSQSGRYLYVVDQGAFNVFVIDVTKIQTGVDAAGRITEPDNFNAVIASIKVGRYPFGLVLSPDDRRLFVTNVGMFQYTHLRPASPVGDDNIDYPLCFPGAGYPNETENARTIAIKKVDPRNLPDSLSDP